MTHCACYINYDISFYTIEKVHYYYPCLMYETLRILKHLAYSVIKRQSWNFNLKISDSKYKIDTETHTEAEFGKGSFESGLNGVK